MQDDRSSSPATAPAAAPAVAAAASVGGLTPPRGQQLGKYPLIDALRLRRSRRFGRGMEIPAGPLAYRSRHAPAPLSEAEQAALAFAACGVTGPALADLAYAPGHGGNIMAGLVGRTIASGDCLQTVALFVIDDDETWFLKRPQDFLPAQIQQLVAVGQRGELTEWFRRTRVRVKSGRSAPPTEPLFNLNVNRWSLHARGTSYFLPVNDLTTLYINGLLEIFNEETAAYILDERAGFRPAGLARFARSRGGHLEDDPARGRVATIKLVEQLVTDFVNVEQGMMHQNLGLMTQALGLGGFPHFANHDFAWFQALGFQMGSMPASRYLGAPWWVALGMRATGKDAPVPYPLALEADGQRLLRALCPPHVASMADAVHAVVALKFGASGVFRDPAGVSAWRAHQDVVRHVPPASQRAIDATIAYCDYVWRSYGRFPAHVPAFRCCLGFQAAHLDAEFYDRFYRPEALSDTQRWDSASFDSHAARCGQDGAGGVGAK
jgi:hypothetical protein